MEGVSEDNNEIYVELAAENLSRALKTAQNARALKVKLTNKHFPCLTVSIELVRRGSGEESWQQGPQGGAPCDGPGKGQAGSCRPHWRWVRAGVCVEQQPHGDPRHPGEGDPQEAVEEPAGARSPGLRRE